MLPEFRLKVVEGRTPSELEQKVEEVVRDIEGTILGRNYQRTTKSFLTFIEYVPLGAELQAKLSRYRVGEQLRVFRERIGAEAERAYLQQILAEHEGNISEASSAAGVSRLYFRKLLQKYDLYQPKEKKIS